MLRYLHEPVKRSGVYWLSVQPDMVLPLTQRGVVGRMETYLEEAHRFSRHLQNRRVCFRYLGVDAEITGKTDSKHALTYWAQQKRRIAMQKARLPSFFASTTWYDWVTAFYDHESMESVKAAGDLARMVSYFCSSEPRRTLEQILHRYWVLMTINTQTSAIHEALVILDACWQEDNTGSRILAWWERQNNTLPALFGLKREDDGKLIIVSKASSVRWGGT